MLEPEIRPNCTTCGLPLAGSACRACGGTGAPLPLADGVASSTSAYAPDPARPELDLAYEAHKNGDYGRVVSHCLAAEGIGGMKMLQTPEGPVFKAVVRGHATFLRVVSASGQPELVIEVPVARLPLTQYIPSLRVLLELSDQDTSTARFSTRGDLVVTRFVGRFATLTPAAVCSALSAVVQAAVECARVLVGALQAREIPPPEHAAWTIEAMPRGVSLADELPTSSLSRKGQGMFESFEPLVDQPVREPARATPVTEIPAVLMPPGGVTMQPAQRGKVPTPARIGRPTPGFITTGQLPPGVKLPNRPSAAPPQTAAVPPTAQVPVAPVAPPGARPGLVPPPRVSASVPPGPIGRTMVSADGAATTEPSAGNQTPTAAPMQRATSTAPAAPPNADPLGDTFISDGQPTAAPPKTGTPADGLCELLHKAQTLGAVLSFADQPATMCLLIRATVYRSINEHDSVLPSAVAALYHATLPMTREIFITAPGKRRGSMAIPPTSPAFEIMARVVAQRGEVDSPEPLAVQPITTAQEAKQHLARYVSEIDQAPSDTDLRHFLALGALSELLVRTKLPPATQDRLRGILAHAKKEGPKQQVVDLMMTALTRMIA